VMVLQQTLPFALRYDPVYQIQKLVDGPRRNRTRRVDPPRAVELKYDATSAIDFDDLRVEGANEREEFAFDSPE
jgi:hypothetical protein